MIRETVLQCRESPPHPGKQTPRIAELGSRVGSALKNVLHQLQREQASWAGDLVDDLHRCGSNAAASSAARRDLRAPSILNHIVRDTFCFTSSSYSVHCLFAWALDSDLGAAIASPRACPASLLQRCVLPRPQTCMAALCTLLPLAHFQVCANGHNLLEVASLVFVIIAVTFCVRPRHNRLVICNIVSTCIRRLLYTKRHISGNLFS